MEAREYHLKDPEPKPWARLQVELDAEVARLTAGKSGDSELEFIYRTRPGPVTRKWAIWELGQRRISEGLKKFGGMIDYEVIAQDHLITFELVWGDNYEALRFGPRAQRDIAYPVLMSERPKDQAPNGHNALKA